MTTAQENCFIGHGNDVVESEDAMFDVLIIGAGWAGLAAANKLVKEGVRSIQILEARDYVGGRSVTTFEFGDDVPVDLGSQWVMGQKNDLLQSVLQGRKNNPVHAFVDQSGVAHAMVKDTFEVRDITGRTLRTEELEKIQKLFDEFMSYMRKRRRIDKIDSNLQVVFDDFIREKGNPDGIIGKVGLEWAIDTTIVQEYASTLSELSLEWWDYDTKFSCGDHMYLTVPGGGFTAVIEKFAHPVRSYVKLETRVTDIEYGSDMVRVSFIKAEQGERNYSTFAKHVLVTVPLGVLKAETIRFSPPLPPAKLNAIENVGFGNMNKCVLYWEAMHESDLFWPKDKEFLMSLAPPGDQGKWTEFYNAYSLNHGIPVLIGFVVGANAWRIEDLSDEEVTAEAVAALRQMFGDKKVPEPTKSIVTRWGRDEYARGAYSFHKVGSHKTSRKDLAKNICKQVWFAGEATDAQYPGETFGALLSGEKAANDILSELVSRIGVVNGWKRIVRKIFNIYVEIPAKNECCIAWHDGYLTSRKVSFVRRELPQIFFF